MKPRASIRRLWTGAFVVIAAALVLRRQVVGFRGAGNIGTKTGAEDLSALVGGWRGVGDRARPKLFHGQHPDIGGGLACHLW